MEIRTGYLEVRLGAMSGNKTTWLGTTLTEFLKAPVLRDQDPIRCLMVIPDKDSERSEEENVYRGSGSTTKNPLLKDTVPFPVLRIETTEDDQVLLKPYLDQLKRYTILAIDEGNFYPDLPEVVGTLLRDYGKRIYVAGLTGDSDQKPFGRLLELLPMADHFEKQTGKCSLCFQSGQITEAPFTACLEHKTSQVLVGNNPYVTVCRKHYDQIALLLDRQIR